MSRSGCPSEARAPVFKSPSKLDTPLSTHCRWDERLSQPRTSWEENADLWRPREGGSTYAVTRDSARFAMRQSPERKRMDGDREERRTVDRRNLSHLATTHA
ncbi:hypothetical protein TNCV_909671 [Trichonephila clavipes]|nr:hypothetical protein TNCV_909671 [Trichonephila clavipes]